MTGDAERAGCHKMQLSAPKEKLAELLAPPKPNPVLRAFALPFEAVGSAVCGAQRRAESV